MTYAVAVDVLSTDCAPGGLPLVASAARATVTQDGLSIGWVLRSAAGGTNQWALSGRLCEDSASATGWRVHVAGGRVTRVTSGELSCRVDAVLPADGRLDLRPTCDDPAIELRADDCGVLRSDAVTVRLAFDETCPRAPACSATLRWIAQPERLDSRAPADAGVGCAADSGP